MSEPAIIKHTVNDNVFMHLFSDPKLELYHVLHPENTMSQISDLKV